MLRLPHPELAGLVETIKRDVVGTRRASVVGVEVPYSVYRPNLDTAPIVGCYDEGGTIYVSEELVGVDAHSADLTAYHEHVEIRHKRAPAGATPTPTAERMSRSYLRRRTSLAGPTSSGVSPAKSRRLPGVEGARPRRCGGAAARRPHRGQGAQG
ncbi:MAG: hypothetical protein WKH64_12585 [Chloroflexia bacterium]